MMLHFLAKIAKLSKKFNPRSFFYVHITFLELNFGNDKQFGLKKKELHNSKEELKFDTLC